MQWLIGYVRDAVLPPWITANPAPLAATVGDNVSFTCAGDGSPTLAYQWSKDGVAIAGNASASTPMLVLNAVTTADAGSYACTVSNAAGAADERLRGAQRRQGDRPGHAERPGPDLRRHAARRHRRVGAAGRPARRDHLQRQRDAADAARQLRDRRHDRRRELRRHAPPARWWCRRSYVSRHAPTLNGRVESSVQVLLPEDVTLNGIAVLKGDLLVPGTPTVVANRRASFRRHDRRHRAARRPTRIASR